MSIVSQLFCAADLKQLDENQLRTLRDTVKAHFNPTLDITLNTIVKNPARMTSAVIRKIQDQARQVFVDLKARQPSPFPDALNLALPLFPQLFAPVDLQDFTAREREIMEIAISCEVANFNFYDHLQTVKERAYETFILLTGNGPAGPNTYYSPFNLNSPQHSLLNPQTWP